MRVCFFEKGSQGEYGGQVDGVAREAAQPKEGTDVTQQLYQGETEDAAEGKDPDYLVDSNSADACIENSTFEIVRMGTDRRLLINRKSQLKMYLCWTQGGFRKQPEQSNPLWRLFTSDRSALVSLWPSKTAIRDLFQHPV